ncbi:MAG: hypothetical protein R3C26_03845 [Calditrichia bacterium]
MKLHPRYRHQPVYACKYDVDLRLSIDAGTKPVLLFVGRLVKEKDLDDLIKMAKILEQRNLPHNR